MKINIREVVCESWILYIPGFIKSLIYKYGYRYVMVNVAIALQKVMLSVIMIAPWV